MAVSCKNCHNFVIFVTDLADSDVEISAKKAYLALAAKEDTELSKIESHRLDQMRQVQTRMTKGSIIEGKSCLSLL